MYSEPNAAIIDVIKKGRRNTQLICIESSFDFQIWKQKSEYARRERETHSWESHKGGTWDDHHGRGESASNQDYIHMQNTEDCH